MVKDELKLETRDLIAKVLGHRVFAHSFFSRWTNSAPKGKVVAALFHQIQKFCASTRPGYAFPEALRSFGFSMQADLVDEIVASESGHGPELATMAAYIVNRSPASSSGDPMFLDVSHQFEIERRLKIYSDEIFGTAGGYDTSTGLTAEAAGAISVLELRQATDLEATLQNLGTALALEIVSNRHLIPAEKAALVDSGHYAASLDDTAMHYLKEHWGECGAEQQHEEHVIAAVDDVVSPETVRLIERGANRFLESLASLWDRLETVMEPIPEPSAASR